MKEVGISLTEINCSERVFYGEHESQFGELWLPKGNGAFPIAIVIHGGFWRSQFDLEHMNAMCHALTKEGVACWNIEYRRVGQQGGGWPGTFHDIAKAINHLFTHKEKYPLDASRIILIGHSAGGHLALWFAGKHNISEPNRFKFHTKPIQLNGVISLAGVSDLKMMYDIHQWKETLFKIVDNPTRNLLGGSPVRNEERYNDSSPIELLPLNIPVVLIHGNLDVNVPVGMSEYFSKKAKEAGDSVRLHVLSDTEHFSLIRPETTAWSIVLESVNQLLL